MSTPPTLYDFEVADIVTGESFMVTQPTLQLDEEE